MWEMTILHALKLRGADVKYVLCDGLYTDCDVFGAAYNPRRQESCKYCQEFVAKFVQGIGMPFEWLGNYLTQNDFKEANEWIDNLSVTDYQTATYQDCKLGEWVESSLHTHFRMPDLDLSLPQIQEGYCNYLYSGLVAYFGLSRLLDEYKPDILFLFNGRMSSTRIALELARKLEIRVIVHERGFLSESLSLFENVTSLSLYPFTRLWKDWSNIPLNKVELEEIGHYITGRQYGKNLNWRAFSPPPQNIDKLLGDLYLNATRPVWVLFTSTDDEVVVAKDWESLFHRQIDWIQKTVEYISHHPEIDLVIRVHPNTAGSKAGGDNVQQFQQMDNLRQHLPQNVRMVMPDDPISSYSLMDIATLGLVFNSTTGLEMACKGKQVIVAAGCSFSDAPYVKTVQAVEEYEKMLDAMLQLPLMATYSEIQRMAYRHAYGIFFRLNIPFPLVKMPNPHNGILAYTSIDQLLPGLEHNLDRACRIILEKEPACPPPSEKDLMRDETEEIGWFTDKAEARRKALEEYAKKKQMMIDKIHPQASVIILCHNNAQNLERAVRSVLDQSYKKFEIIIVNDGSTDDTQQVAEYLIATNPEYLFELVNQPISGHPSIARNSGIEKAKGEYILCLDADQVIAPHFLQECAGTLDTHPNISIAYPSIKQIGDMVNVIPPAEYHSEILRHTNFIPAASLFRKKAWEVLGGFDLKADDNGYHKFWIACAEQKHFGQPVPKAIVFHYISGKEAAKAIEHIHALMKSQNLAEADIALKYSLEKYPDVPDLHNLRAVLKIHSGDREGAKSLLLDIIKKWPTYFIAYNDLACIYWDAGEYENAAKHFEEALRIGNYERHAVIAYGEMLMSLKKYSMAKEIFTRYLGLNPADGEVQTCLNKCEKVLGKLSELSRTIVKEEPDTLMSAGDKQNPFMTTGIKDLRFISATEYLQKNPSHGTSFDLEKSRDGDIAHHMFVLNDFILAGPLGFPVSRNGEVIEDKFIYFQIFKNYLQTISPEELSRSHLKKKTGKYLPLYGDWAEGFWHWITENLPYVMIAEDSGYDGYYIIPPSSHAKQSMELLGIKPDRILEHHGDHWLVETLYLPQRIQGQALIHYPDILSSLRQRLLDKIETPAETFSRKKIYISRNKLHTQRRIIVNEDALLELLAPLGFETVYMEKMSLKEQIALVASADTLITPHGAGTIHTLFMPPKSLVIELFSPIYINPVALPAIDLLKHKYFMIPSHFDSPQNPVYSHGHNIEAFLEIIAITLKRELGSGDAIKEVKR